VKNANKLFTLFIFGDNIFIETEYNLQGRVKFPIGGNAAIRLLARERKQTWLDSGADSKVWMKEDAFFEYLTFPEIIFQGILHFGGHLYGKQNKQTCKNCSTFSTFNSAGNANQIPYHPLSSIFGV
jgi:hypothetical protein